MRIVYSLMLLLSGSAINRDPLKNFSLRVVIRVSWLCSLNHFLQIFPQQGVSPNDFSHPTRAIYRLFNGPLADYDVNQR
jgi:hypothetical protein